MGRRWATSLRARLLWLLFAAISLAVTAQSSVAYRMALGEADEIFDYHMQQTAMSLRLGLPLTESPQLERLAGTDQDDAFIVQVWTVDGLPVFRSIDRPDLPPYAKPGFWNARVRDTQYRLFSVASRTHVIQVAQDVAVRSNLARKLALRTIAPIIVMAPLLMLVVWWVVSASLAPVWRVRRQVAQRQADDLSEVGDAGLPDEIAPLIDELNLLFRRLRQAFDAQRSFVADAAHELRSPLAALKLQVQGLQRGADDESRSLYVGRLHAGIDRATRLVDQLLVLARQQASAASGDKAQPVSLTEIARLELSDAAEAAQLRHIDLGLAQGGDNDIGPTQALPGDLGQAPIDDVQILGHHEALRILVRNLLDNAIKYTPPGGAVDLSVHHAVDAVILRVDDSGPGIPIADRERALDRFHRITGNAAAGDASGSGLGLAIVKDIAELHGATLALGEAKRRGGLRVEVRFPQ